MILNMTASKEKVRVYSTQTCPFCDKAKDFLRAHKIPFEEIDVGRDHKAAMEMVKKSGQIGAPVIEIGKKVITGFDKEEIKKSLKIK